MTAARSMSPSDQAAARFAADTAKHEMTILHDDGHHRHLRFERPSRPEYWFEVATWPDRLAFVGDGDGFIFSCTGDMFEFFRGSAHRAGPNPGYWATKVAGGRGDVYGYSLDLLEQYVAEALQEAEADCPGVTAAWAAFVETDYNTEYEESARAAVADFTWKAENAERDDEPFRFADTADWKLHDFDWWFPCACQAIVWGVARYDAALALAQGATPAAVTE